MRLLALLGCAAALTAQVPSGGGSTGSGGGGTPTITVERYMVAAKCQSKAAGLAFSHATENFPTPTCVSGTNTEWAVARFTATSQWVQDHFLIPAVQVGNIDVV